MRPTVSVIVPVYNAEKFLSRCLESLIKQTLEGLEIVIINDGSTDKSQEIIDEYRNKHNNVVVYTQENVGIAETRNVGLSKATGEYIGFIDSDDYAESTMFEKMYNQAKMENAEIVVSNFEWVHENGNRKLQKEGPYLGGKEMIIHLFATLWNKIYKTDWVKETGLQFPKGNRYEDAYFLYCLAPQVEKIVFIEETFVSYVQHSQSITHTHNNQVKNMITVFELISEYYKENGWYEIYHEELEYVHIRFFLGNSFLRSAQIKDSKDREETILLGWDLLNREFPNWNKNKYLKQLGGLKNQYFRMVRRWNIMGFAFLFHHLKKNTES